MKNRDETEETIQKLGGIVFVQTVEGSALSSYSFNDSWIKGK